MGDLKRRLPGRKEMRRFPAVMLLCILLMLCGCQARPGTNALPKEKASSSASSGDSGKKDSGKKKSTEDSSGSGRSDEDEPDEESEAAASLPAVDPEAEAQRLIDERLGELCFYYTGNFGVTDKLNPAQIYWSVFKWYSAGPDYKAPAKPDYTGYEQLDAKTIRKLAERWYGPNVPEYEGNLSALGDPATGELINVSENGNTYYFLEVEMPMEETHTLQNARADDDGTLTVRISAQDSSGTYLRTYLCKLKPDGNGDYYLISLSKGQT